MPDLKITDPLFDTKQAAKYIGYKNPKSLVVMRSKKDKRIQWLKIGRNVRYRKSECDRYLASCLVR